MYKKALQMRLRFDTAKGTVNVEDLFSMGLEELDALAQRCQAEASSASASFIKKVVKNEKAELRFSIVKDVIETRLTALDEAAADAKRKEQKAKIMEIMARKQDASLEEASLEDLQAMLAEL